MQVGVGVFASGLEAVDLVTETVVVGSVDNGFVIRETTISTAPARFVVALAVTAAAILAGTARPRRVSELGTAPLAASHGG